jgi:hypothetical protein
MHVSRRHFIGGACSLALLPGCVSAGASGDALQRIVDRHVRARGGAAALDRVRSCLVELDITERGQTISGRYAADAAGLVRIDIHAGGELVYREGVDSQGVWLWPQGDAAPRASEATGAANALLHGAENHLFGLHRFAERGHRLRLMPAERIDGVEYPVIEVVYRTGHTSYFYVDPESWLLVRRRDRRAYHPDADATQQRIETLFSDFRSVDGVVASHHDVDREVGSGTVLASHQVTRRILNPRLPPGVFDRTYQPGLPALAGRSGGSAPRRTGILFPA